MLSSKETLQVAGDLVAEAKRRQYVRALIPGVVDDDEFWHLVVDLVEIVLHRRGYVIAPRDILRGDEDFERRPAF